MDNEFKIPAISEPKFKTPSNKSDDKVDDLPESKQKIEDTVENVPAEQKIEKPPSKVNSTNFPPCPYEEPKWSKPPNSELNYKFEILKQGRIVITVDKLQSKAFWKIGKLPTNDILMEHPTVSRYHAVLQYLPEAKENYCEDENENENENEDDKIDSGVEKKRFEQGWYLYDLASTHGSFVNKKRIPPKTYVRVRVGFFLKFGGSTKSFILQGPDFDAEPESELSITEMKELRIQKQMEFEQNQIEEEKRREEEIKRKEQEGISWGMADDAEEETDLSHNPFAVSANEELFLDDPKKTLRGYFEREGLDLEYKVDEISNGTYLCRIELPITDAIGRSIFAEFTHKGKKKDCVAQAALEACRILDRNGLLRQANHEPRKRKVESSDEDDDFYDRTTAAEEKRRRKAEGEEKEVILSYEQLLEEEKKLQFRLIEIEQRIERYKKTEKDAKKSVESADLDDYMSGLSNEKTLDKTDIRKSRFELQQIKGDITKVKKMIEIARPVNLMPIAKHAEPGPSEAKKKLELPLFGKKRTFGFSKLKTQVLSKPKVSDDQNETIEEFDEVDDEQEKKKEIIAPAPVTLSEKSSEKEIDTQKKCAEAAPKKVSPVVASEMETIEKEDIDAELDKPNNQSELNNEKQTKENTTHQIDSEQPSTAEKSDKKPKPNPSQTKPINVDFSKRKKQLRKLVDIDDAEEDDKKFSKWLPPKDQSGDGVTHLNAKFGY